jgi:hypothetical protein
MITVIKQSSQSQSVPSNEQFLEFIPAIERYARQAFGKLRSADRDEAICEVLANAFRAFRRLLDLDKLNVAYPSPLARFAVAQVKSGRRIGSKPNSRDVFSFVAQRRQGFSLETQKADDGKSRAWIEMLVDSRLTPVVDQVAFRLDFRAWLGIQNKRRRMLVEYLALGNTTSQAARRFGVSSARISQLRRELQVSWQLFQSDDH